MNAMIRMALHSKVRPNGRGLGTESQAALETAEKSTAPKIRESTYPAATPARTLADARKPLAYWLRTSVTRRTTKAIPRFSGDP
jgi:hypothetical protein